jgi:iron-sulfur cluster assembly protein
VYFSNSKKISIGLILRKGGKGNRRNVNFSAPFPFQVSNFAPTFKRAFFMEAVLEHPTTAAPLSLTQGAVEQLKQIRNQENIPADYCLRVGVKGGGCSGFSYILGFDLPQDNDDVFDANGIRVVMNKAHAIYLLGMEVDFVSGLDNRGFTFDNPNATSTCGCGTSFSA